MAEFLIYILLGYALIRRVGVIICWNNLRDSDIISKFIEMSCCLTLNLKKYTGSI